MVVDKQLFVNFKSGFCGEFILSLLMLMEDPDRKNITVLESGSCHKNRNKELELVVPKDYTFEQTNKVVEEFVPQTYLNKSHVTHISSILTYFKNSKIINIVLRENDKKSAMIIAKNIFSKVMMTEDYGVEWFNNEKNKLGITAETPAHMTKNELNGLLSHLQGEYLNLANTKKSHDRVHTLTLDTIYNHKNDLFNQLSSISGFSISQSSLNFYDEYMNKQNSLQNTIDNWVGLDDERLDKIKKTWCMTPWFEMYVKPDGEVFSCCDNAPSAGIAGSINESSLSEIFNSDHYREIRKAMLNGEKPEPCSRCYQREDLHGRSLRTVRSEDQYTYQVGLWDQKEVKYEELPSRVDSLIRNLTEEWDGSNINKLKIDFSNGCNLKCQMCSPHRSTAWFKDKFAMDKEFNFNDGYKEWNFIKDPLLPDKTKIFSASIPLEFIDDNWNEFLSMDVIEVSGGEPFFHPQFLYLIDKLEDSGWNGTLKLISNITLLTDEYLEKINKFQTRLCISCDGYGDLYEYIRPGTPIGKYKWNHIEETIYKIMQCENISYSFSYVSQLLNFYNIIDWLEFAVGHDKKRWNPFFSEVLGSSVLFYPFVLRSCHHPDPQEKIKLKNTLLLHYDWVSGVDSVIKSLEEPTTEADWKAFCKYNNFLDKQRNTSILKYIPQFEKYWIND